MKMRIKQFTLRVSFSMVAVIASASSAHANEGPLWFWMLLSPLIIFQKIPFLFPCLLAVGVLLFLWRFQIKRKNYLLISAIICGGLSAWLGVHEMETRRVEIREQALQQQRIEATRGRIRAMYEGKPVPPLDEKALISEAQKNLKSTGDAEKDRLNRQAAEELVRMKVAVDSIQNNRQQPPPERAEPQQTVTDQFDVCEQWRAGDRASELVEKARKLHPEYKRLSPQEAHAKGLEHYRRREYASAIWAWECEAIKNPKAKDAVNDIGIAYLDLNNPPLSLRFAQKALGIDPDFAHAHHTEGYALLSMGRYSSARRAAYSAAMGGWDPSQSYFVLGLALKGLHEVSEGNKALRTALAAQPQNNDIRRYAEGENYVSGWQQCREVKAASPKANIKSTPQRMEKSVTHKIQLPPEVVAWDEVKGKFPVEFEGRKTGDMEAEAKIRFNGKEPLVAAALWLKVSQEVKDTKTRAHLWALAARAMGKHVSDTTPTTGSKTSRLETPLLLAKKALSNSPDDEDVVYATALLQYESLDFKVAADILKSADKRIRMGLPSLHLMEVVYGLAGDYPARRDAALRIGYDPLKTAAGWRPYDWDMWRATCQPSDDVKRMNPDGSAKMTREGVGGVFLLLIIIASAAIGRIVASRIAGKSGARWIHFAAVVCVAVGAVTITGLFEEFAANLFRNAFMPWFGFVMTLPVLVIVAYCIGCLIGANSKKPTTSS